MDSQDKTFQQEAVEEVKAAEQVAEVENQEKSEVTEQATAVDDASDAATETPEAPEAPADAADAATKTVYETKQQVLERLKEIAHEEENPQKAEIDYLKTTFYKLHFAEREAQQKAYLDAGGDPET